VEDGFGLIESRRSNMENGRRQAKREYVLDVRLSTTTNGAKASGRCEKAQKANLGREGGV
jgi:hypothetical protein